MNEFWQAIVKAFELIFSGNQTLGEIIGTTLSMTLSSSLLSFLFGVPVGILIACNNFRGKRAVQTVVSTLMGLPPVAVGIFIYLLFRGIGPFGGLGMLYTVEIMVLSQFVLLFPIAVGLTQTALTSYHQAAFLTMKGLGIRGAKRLLLTANEGRFELISVFLYVFARSMAEVGAVQIVGGNILHKTRVMTTTIALSYNTGSFQLAIALGIILLLLNLTLNCIASMLQRAVKRN